MRQSHNNPAQAAKPAGVLQRHSDLVSTRLSDLAIAFLLNEASAILRAFCPFSGYAILGFLARFRSALQLFGHLFPPLFWILRLGSVRVRLHLRLNLRLLLLRRWLQFLHLFLEATLPSLVPQVCSMLPFFLNKCNTHTARRRQASRRQWHSAHREKSLPPAIPSSFQAAS